MLCIDCSWRKLQPALSPLSMNRQHRSCISLSNDSNVLCLVRYPCFHKQYVMYAKYVICQKMINTTCCISKSALTNCGFSMPREGQLVRTHMPQSQYYTVFDTQICLLSVCHRCINSCRFALLFDVCLIRISTIYSPRWD